VLKAENVSKSGAASIIRQNIKIMKPGLLGPFYGAHVHSMVPTE